MTYWIELLNLIGIYAILALSLNVICGLTGLLQLGHAGFFAAGAYAAGLVSVYWFHPDWGFLNFGVSAVAAVAVVSILALAIGTPCLRLSGDYLAIATLGFGEIVRLTLNNVEFPGCAWTDGARFGGATGFRLPEAADYIHTTEVNPMANGPGSGLFARLQANPFENSILAGGYELVLNTWFVWLFVLLTFVVLRNTKRSAIGRVFLAIREDEIAARSMGVNVPAYKILAFLLSAAFAGLAGALYAHAQLSVSPGEFTLLHTITILLIVVLGGLGSFSGSLLAAVLIVGIPELLRLVPTVLAKFRLDVTVNFARWEQIVFALLLILLVRFVPNGLFDMQEFGEVWRRFREKRG
jgi:branched-chain amino acid transport system permease protein